MIWDGRMKIFYFSRKLFRAAQAFLHMCLQFLGQAVMLLEPYKLCISYGGNRFMSTI